jgi:hypothetical protein
VDAGTQAVGARLAEARSAGDVPAAGARVTQVFAALLSGLVFGAGLALAGMTNPAKVLAFLDVAGAWDPTLALVMGGALAVNAVAFALTRRRVAPLFADAFSLPTQRDLDAPLLGGAALFGIGWGLVGLCPGPAVASLVRGTPEVWGFVAAMLVGMLVRGLAQRGR